MFCSVLSFSCTSGWQSGILKGQAAREREFPALPELEEYLKGMVTFTVALLDTT